jgi:hypothetical protein
MDLRATFLTPSLGWLYPIALQLAGLAPVEGDAGRRTAQEQAGVDRPAVRASIPPGRAAGPRRGRDTAGRPGKGAVTRPLTQARQARGVAEDATGGIAVSARRIPLNGATGGWVVDVHMPGEARGWRCVVDRDTRSVHSRTRIPNPPAGQR